MVSSRQTRKGTDPLVGAERRAELRRRGNELLRMTADLIDAEGEIVPEAAVGLRTLDGQLAILGGFLRDRLLSADEGADWSALVRVSIALADLHTVRFEIHDFLLNERLRRLDALETGLARLRRIHDPDELINRVCEAVVESCGFDRVMLSRVEDSRWRPWKSYAVGDRQPERTFRAWIRGIPEIHLDHLLLESEMVRRREAAIVTDGTHDPRVARVLVQASGLTSYVAAPLVPGDRVVGFLHADYESSEVVPLDRDILAAFARAFDQIFESAVLLRRLKEQRDQVRATMHSVDAILDDLASAEIELASHGRAGALSASRPTRSQPSPESARLEALLTKREFEVLSLMATGATNDRIAERLVITSGTVKSHVKRILRKLRAENRAEAISQYLRLTIGRNQG